MRIWSRLAALTRSHVAPTANGQTQGSTDPEIALARQREVLRRLRQELVALAAERNRLDMQIKRLRLRSARSGARARQAVAAGQDEQARFQLLRRQAAERQIAALESQQDRLAGDELRLARRERLLAQQIDSYRKRYRELIARGAASDVLVRLGPKRLAGRSRGSDWAAERTERDRRSA